jgi:hypothetical protein
VRLFAVAHARRLADRLPAEHRGAVDVGERLADGLATEEERLHFVHLLYAVVPDFRRTTGQNWFMVTPAEEVSAHCAALAAVGRWKPDSNLADNHPNWEVARKVGGDRQPTLLREIFGNPFRPVPFSQAWRTDTTLALARQMYEARDFSAVPILADALQDAGCDNEDILNHCRAPGVHVRGCWVVDLVLGKE